MLVLTRKKSQVVRIGNEIEVMVVEVRGDKVRLGITAPTHIPVHRHEVFEAIQRENPPDETGTFGVAKFDDPK